MLIPGDSGDWRCQHGNVHGFHTGWSLFTALLLQQPLQFSARSGTDACLHRDLLSCFWKRKENGNYDNRQTCGMRRRKQASRKPTVMHWGQASCFPCYPILTQTDKWSTWEWSRLQHQQNQNPPWDRSSAIPADEEMPFSITKPQPCSVITVTFPSHRDTDIWGTDGLSTTSLPKIIDIQKWKWCN